MELLVGRGRRDLSRPIRLLNGSTSCKRSCIFLLLCLIKVIIVVSETRL